MLFAAAILAFCIGLVHSYLGERFILIRLFKRDAIPHLFGSDAFTKGTLRFAWHLTTVAWWGFAVILLLLNESASSKEILNVIAAVFLISAILAAVFTRGRHLSWIVFLTISILTLLTSVKIAL